MEYKDTLNLPKTDFPMKANLKATEEKFLKEWEESGLYKNIIEKAKNRPKTLYFTTALPMPTAIFI
jgi:Isoleucyl-tRNA synthetase (EC 6.1.1.5)